VGEGGALHRLEMGGWGVGLWHGADDSDYKGDTAWFREHCQDPFCSARCARTTAWVLRADAMGWEQRAAVPPATRLLCGNAIAAAAVAGTSTVVLRLATTARPTAEDDKSLKIYCGGRG